MANLDIDINLRYIDKLLSDEECDSLIKLSNNKFSNSVVISKSGKSYELNKDRTSQTYFVDETDPNAKIVRKKIIDFLNKNTSVNKSKDWNKFIERTQIVKYDIGQEYKAHYDYFTTEYLMKDSNQREYTIFIYLNDVVGDGGETYFPNLNIKIKPKKGCALFWRNCTASGECLKKSLHQGLPPLEGEKYGMNVWIRMSEIN